MPSSAETLTSQKHSPVLPRRTTRASAVIPCPRAGGQEVHGQPDRRGAWALGHLRARPHRRSGRRVDQRADRAAVDDIAHAWAARRHRATRALPAPAPSPAGGCRDGRRTGSCRAIHGRARRRSPAPFRSPIGPRPPWSRPLCKLPCRAWPQRPGPSPTLPSRPSRRRGSWRSRARSGETLPSPGLRSCSPSAAPRSSQANAQDLADERADGLTEALRRSPDAERGKGRRDGRRVCGRSPGSPTRSVSCSTSACWRAACG